MTEKSYTKQDIDEMFLVVDCSSKEICNNIQTQKCKTCLRNRFHTVLKDNFEIKKFKLEE
jgi:hypothetical protein